MLPQRPVQLRCSTSKPSSASTRQIYNWDMGPFSAKCLGTKVPAGSPGMGLAVCLPEHPAVSRPRSGAIRRHHVHENGLQRAVKHAARQAGLAKSVDCHTLRNAFDIMLHLIDKY